MRECVQQNILVAIICLAVSILFVTLASYSTSPLYPYCFGSDSAQFQTIGKAWTESLLPYRDLFDHKGPLIFLINALGYALLGSKYGVYLLQVVFFALTLHGVFLLTRYAPQRLRFRLGYFLILCLVFVIFLGEAYDGGNLTEEYCLPFLMYSTYFQLQYLLERQHECPASYAAFYGLTLAVCLLTRVTNAVALVCSLVCIFFSLLGQKQYKTITRCVLAFLTGFGLPVALFALYFFQKGALFDCCYGTLLYNLEYQRFMVSWLKCLSVTRVYDFALSFFPVYAMLFVAYVAVTRRNTLFLATSLFICLCELYLFCSGSLYPHYAVVCFPQLIIIINEAVSFFSRSITDKRFFLRWQALFCLAFLIVTYCNAQDFAYRVARNYLKYRSCNALVDEARMGELVKKIFLDKPVVVYGGENCKDFYLRYGFLPCYKYFVLQEWHARFSPAVREDIRKVFSQRRAEAIVVSGNDENIRDILALGYQSIASDGAFRLYRKTALEQ